METQVLLNDNIEASTVSRKKWVLPFIVLFLVLLIDQMLKYWVKNNMIMHTERHIIGNWFLFHFTENNGMAFGMEFFGKPGKYALTILRIAVSGFGFWYLISNIKKNYNTWFLICVALILGGAIGNIIDSIFYGAFYHHMNDYPGLWLQGRVVDMLYFPIIETVYPSWSPIKAGQDFIFFSPVFNIADTAISAGIISIIVFQKRFFPTPLNEETTVVEKIVVLDETQPILQTTDETKNSIENEEFGEKSE